MDLNEYNPEVNLTEKEIRRCHSFCVHLQLLCTSDRELSMLQAVHGDDTNSIQVVVVHNLELLPFYWTRLTF